MSETVTVIGAGLAGVEAAWQLAEAGIEVVLYEMKPTKYSPAHHLPTFAELVCSNSLKAKRLESAAGLLKEEMRRMGSLCMQCAPHCEVAAGGALAVDRDRFSALISEKIESHPLINVVRQEMTAIPNGNVIVAAGPLASDALSEDISALCGEGLHFFDAAAPIVTAESINMESAFTASRYDRGGDDDYINCPMNKEEYEAFYAALVSAESADLHSFDKRKDVYEGCMPIEVMASRGADTMRFGPLKPVGLRDPKTGHRPWAVLQLRKENANGTMYNLVGFQTNLKFGEQKRVFSMIPALKNADFVRYGVMHRNTFLDSPRLLNGDFSFRKRKNLFFAGQITGVEGYMESAASGIMAGYNMVRTLQGKETIVLPETTMIGALSRYISDSSVKNFQPMGANFGVLPPIEPKIRDKKLRYAALSERALAALEEAIKEEV
ncbi:MAG: methylenetetrahydrofolate--tRNA-(uracil(54)-C(5))-methyltransferase (FADH(2)-oxidizing) TrmFO [Faecalibacterium sp.]|nr:methylenetetrahydrofolate--tRNA-(uracil(54)-C(5))-methyltransferase (FADH(2)-oxidizing) TrmFO [Ruminococcus sp.]MCM1391589.1 methylenetetrahydrofolate--tRNA-(uracil(54)-C(5))-methyltransferase (FADH(2)-oxidizing) TrmFO [Ruminococcus sp.]MCM1486699.1 methylenetetrahydrofolate--tRNA-(uracil(54)-C(5))-methyltransferase (FADH(2)-oxidizing) TrmFO [Faecalibacterium sp.]